VVGVELAAQLFQPAVDARPHRGTGHSEAPCDLARRKLVIEAQQQRSAVELLEREDGGDDAAPRLLLLDDVRRRAHRLAARAALFAVGTPLGAALVASDEVFQRARQPGAEVAHASRPAKRGQPDFLDDVVGAGGVPQEASGETS
jgi:hypothetical protein